MDNLKAALIDELKDLYSAEQQIVKALPEIIKGAESEDLQTAIAHHLEETKVQVSRLEQAFAALGESATAKHCKGMEGLLDEGAECLKEKEKGTLRDLLLIGAAQRVEHYEIAAYGTAKAMAEHLDLDDVIDLLAETEEEEAAADEKLTDIAEGLYEELGQRESAGVR